MKMSSKLLLGGLFGASIALTGQLTATQVSVSAKSKTAAKYAVTVALKSTDKQGMVNRVYDTADPTSDAFRQYYSPKQVANHYGRSTSDINKFKNYFKKYHVSASAYPGNLFLKVKGTYKNVTKAFKAKIKGKYTAYTLPKNLKSQISSVIGLVGNYKLWRLNQGFVYDHNVATTESKPEFDGKKSTFSKKYGPMKFGQRYKLDQVYDKGLSGKGQHIGIVAGSDFYLKDVQKYLKQNGLSTNVSRIHKIYLGSKYLSRITMVADPEAQAETTLDVQQAASVAPGADVDVYINPEINTQMTLDAGIMSTFNSAIGDNLAKQISTSMDYGNEVSGLGYKLSETKRQYSAAYNQMFEQAALQGQTVFSASGDNGPYAEVSKHFNQSMLTSPYLVSVGGTTLPYATIQNGRIINVKKERAWGDTYNVDPSQRANTGSYPGSGGGFSRLNATPKYQLGVPGVNTFTAIQHLKYVANGTLTSEGPGMSMTIKGIPVLNRVKNPRVIHGTGSGRNLPDIAAAADPNTGYAMYLTTAHRKNKKGSATWSLIGGTSATAPQMAAANAVMNSGMSQPAGFWNPQIYRFAQASESPFTPLNDTFNNDNLYYAGQPGKLYNQATGLGTPDFEKLYAQFNSK